MIAMIVSLVVEVPLMGLERLAFKGLDKKPQKSMPSSTENQDATGSIISNGNVIETETDGTTNDNPLKHTEENVVMHHNPYIVQNRNLHVNAAFEHVEGEVSTDL